jgi:hypothetical protein
MRTQIVMALLAGAAASGCIVGGACTTIGCADGVNVEWSGATMRERGTLVIDGEILAFDCAAGPTAAVWCTPKGLRLTRTPTTLRVEVITDRGTRSGSFTPQYTSNRPNGPDCDPVCRGATVTVP